MLLLGQLAKRNPDDQGGEQVRIYARGSAKAHHATSTIRERSKCGTRGSGDRADRDPRRLRQEGSCGRRRSEAPTPVTVETAVRGAIDRVVTADAVLYPVNQANVTAKISAPVKRVLVNRGDHVRAGQLLAELESADLAAAANESQHQYRTGAGGLSDLLTGATVSEDQAKAQTDVQAAQTDVGRGQEGLRQPRRAAARRSAGAEDWWTTRESAMVQAQSQLDMAQQPSARR